MIVGQRYTRVYGIIPPKFLQDWQFFQMKIWRKSKSWLRNAGKLSAGSKGQEQNKSLSGRTAQSRRDMPGRVRGVYQLECKPVQC